MVRVISQGFSTPRSRHSSGEDMIDRFAAMKALSALDEEKHQIKENYGCKPLVIDCNTDTNDSFSGLESEEDTGASCAAKDLQNNNTLCQDPGVMKRERRRERNKLSAQSYRQRRRQQNHAAQKTLESLEAHNKSLLEKVRQLEAEKHIVEDYLRSCVRVPWNLQKQTTPCPCTTACAGSASACANAANINNINCSSIISTTATQSPLCSDSCCPTPCNTSISTTTTTATAANFTPLFTPSTSQSAVQSGFACNINQPDNFRFHEEDFRGEPLNMVVEKNNNVPVRMPGVAMTPEGSSVS